MFHIRDRPSRRRCRPSSGSPSGDISTMGSSSLRDPGLGELPGDAAGGLLLSPVPKELSQLRPQRYTYMAVPVLCCRKRSANTPLPDYPRTGTHRWQPGATPNDAVQGGAQGRSWGRRQGAGGRSKAGAGGGSAAQGGGAAGRGSAGPQGWRGRSRCSWVRGAAAGGAGTAEAAGCKGCRAALAFVCPYLAFVCFCPTACITLAHPA